MFVRCLPPKSPALLIITQGQYNKKMNGKLFQIVIVLFLRLAEAMASSCGDQSAGTIEKLICSTQPAILAALNPGLALKDCKNSEFAGPQVHSGDMPVSGVFVSCTVSSKNACREIAKSILQNGRGATVNVLISKSDLVDLEPVLQEIIKFSSAKAPLNIIPVSQEPASYMRDPGLFRSDGTGAIDYVAQPYLLGASLGDQLMQEVTGRCGIGFTAPYKDLEKFDSAYRLLTEDTLGQLTILFGPEYAKYALQTLKTEEQRKHFIISRMWSEEKNNADAKIMGGNFLGLPGGILFAGAIAGTGPDPDLMKYFEKSQKVKMVELPKLAVGHIDEIFNIVPSLGTCGFTLLRASPREMKKFLTSRPGDEVLGNLTDTLEQVQLSMNPTITSTIERYNEALANISEIRSKGGVISPSQKIEFETIRHEWLKATHRQYSAGDVLSNGELMKLWDERQKTIDDSTAKILSEIKSEKNCEPNVIDLPVYWSKNGEPLLSNPVNGLAVNGNYFRSAVQLPLEGNPLNSLKSEPIPYGPFEAEIQKRLTGIFGKNQTSVDTHELDIGKGNFHCATTNIYMPCK